MTQSLKSWPWLVLGANADSTSFTALGLAPSQQMAVQIANGLRDDRRTIMVVQVAHQFDAAPAQQITVRDATLDSATVTRLRRHLARKDGGAA